MCTHTETAFVSADGVKNEDRIYLPVYNPILIFRTLHKFYLIFKIL